VDDRRPGSVVLFLAREGRAERLLDEHVGDDTGQCTDCSAAPQTGRKRWPCTLAEYAAAARDLVAGHATPQAGRRHMCPPMPEER
jgi:hypothetical protein